MSMSELMCPMQNINNENYTRHLLGIEKNFDLCWAFEWLTRNWNLCFYFMAFYLAAIYTGRKVMEPRQRFEVRSALLYWNVFLALYSIVSAWRMIGAMGFAIQNHGFKTSICTMESLQHRQAVGLWMFLFVLSKIAEFGDTFFIVLRKSRLTFLHCYHHVSVAFFVWSTGIFASPMHAYYCTLNVSVHSIMYSYYALKLLGVRIPRQVNIAITILQLLQMAAGMLLTWYIHRAKASDPTCFVGAGAIAIGTSIYFTYFILFLLFFMRSYVTKRKPEFAVNGTSKKLI